MTAGGDTPKGANWEGTGLRSQASSQLHGLSSIILPKGALTGLPLAANKKKKKKKSHIEQTGTGKGERGRYLSI
jgi:hypothetical protein